MQCFQSLLMNRGNWRIRHYWKLGQPKIHPCYPRSCRNIFKVCQHHTSTNQWFVYWTFLGLYMGWIPTGNSSAKVYLSIGISSCSPRDNGGVSEHSGMTLKIRRKIGLRGASHFFIYIVRPWHAVTGFGFLDPTLKRPGLAEALHILRQSRMKTPFRLDYDSLGLLKNIARLIPERKYYPLV